MLLLSINVYTLSDWPIGETMTRLSKVLGSRHKIEVSYHLLLPSPLHGTNACWFTSLDGASSDLLPLVHIYHNSPNATLNPGLRL